MSDDVRIDDEGRERAARAAAETATESQGDGTPRADAGEAASSPDVAQSDVQRQLDEQRDKYLRLAAEYDNFRKRTAKERQESGVRAQGELVKQLADSLDDLHRVTTIDPKTADAATVIQGVDLVEKKLMKTLAGLGLEVINPVDQTFNPALHEAVSTIPALSREDDHTVAQVYQPGYVFKGQLIRPARVVVKQWNG